MKVIVDESTLTVVRGTLDLKYYGATGVGESKLLHFIKTELNKTGLHLVKTRMYKDGHLVDNLQQYLKTDRSRPDIPNIHIWNMSWATAGSEESWNKDGKATFGIQYDIYERGDEQKQKDMLKNLLQDFRC